MATKQEPARRNDVIRCEKCGEDYSTTYKRCPFCDERPRRGAAKAAPSRSASGSGGRRVASGTSSRRNNYGNQVNPVQIVLLVMSLVLIIAALYIVFNAVRPLLGRNEPDVSNPASSSVVSSQPEEPDVSLPEPPASGGDVSVEPEPPAAVEVFALKLDKVDFTLRANESYRINATVDPIGAPVTWTSSNEAAALVGVDGTVVNVNTGSSQVKVTITATAGDRVATCTVYCRGGSTGTATVPTAPAAPSTPSTPAVPSAPSTSTGSGSSISAGSKGVVARAGSGLNVRSGPGSSNNAIASIGNGAEVTILEDSGTGWYKIRFSGIGGVSTEGYVSKDYVDPA